MNGSRDQGRGTSDRGSTDDGSRATGPEAMVPTSGQDKAAATVPMSSTAQDTVASPRDESDRRVKLSIEVTPELNRVIERIATATGASKSETVRKAIVLMHVAVEAKEQGEHLFVGTTPPPGNSREIVGL